MAENNVAVQLVRAQPKLLLNGVEATAQQVYDAFMAGPVRLNEPDGHVSVPTYLYWENSDGTQTNPKAVTYVEIYSAQPDADSGTATWNALSIDTEYTPPVA